MTSLLTSLRRDQRGLSLLELTVVAAIISILAALTAVAVTGTTSTTREVTRTNDIAEVQKAVDRFVNEGTAGAYPTTTDALPNSGAGTTQGTDYYILDEAVLGFDVDGDGASTEVFNVIPIDWAATDSDGKAFYSTYISKKPKHNAETVNGIDDDGTADSIAEAWVIDPNGAVWVLIAPSSY